VSTKTLHFELTIGPEASERRLDHALLRVLYSQDHVISRAGLKEHFKSGDVLIAGKARSASDSLAPGTYTVEIRNWREGKAALPDPRGSLIPIVYEDDDLLILNKPEGVASVPHSPEETDSAVSSALAHFPALSHAGDNPLEAGLLHRLDTGTSGLLVFAKTQDEFARLKAAWKSHEVEKYYRAWSVGAIEAPPGNHRLALGHDAKSAKKMRVIESEADLRLIRGKPLETLTRIESTHHRFRKELVTFSDLEIRIETGAMHQIRCTLSHLKTPILGDSRYRGPEASRLWLHAWRLALPLKNGTRIELEAQLPERWADPV
jgi:23S rRNA pseudouridine1911/1915/1917 synthase